MTHRQIIDENEHLWDVWEVIPSRVEGLDAARGEMAPETLRISKPGRRILVPGELQAGWLAFQCGEDRRRLAPVPNGWAEMSDDALLRVMLSAPPVRKTKQT
jgi:hypothetical protein